jgi:hypothetical protein
MLSGTSLCLTLKGLRDNLFQTNYSLVNFHCTSKESNSLYLAQPESETFLKTS